jgi:hypothetical protein
MRAVQMHCHSPCNRSPKAVQQPRDGNNLTLTVLEGATSNSVQAHPVRVALCLNCIEVIEEDFTIGGARLVCARYTRESQPVEVSIMRQNRS